MKKLLGVAVLLISIAAPTPAPAQSFGGLFPVANTRYGTAMGTPRLSANGQDFFLFWSSERKIRTTSLAQAGPRVGQVVLDTSSEFDVAWTGEVFLAVASRPRLSNDAHDANIIGRVLDTEARPISDELALAEHGREPRIAAGPDAIVMVYRGTGWDTRVLVLGPRGESTGAESWRLPVGGSYAVAGNDAGFVIAIANQEELRAITLDRQGRAVSEYSFARPSKLFRSVALATDGKRYLMAWCESDFGGEVAAVTLDENGSFGTPLVIHRGRTGSLSAVWAGTGWSVAYESDAWSTASRASVAHLDRTARTVIQEEQSAVARVHNPTLAAVNGRLMAAWNPAQYAYDVASVVELPLAAHEPRVVTYAAKQQTLMATASSADATLIVWREASIEFGTSIHTGVRTNDGQWTETELAAPGIEAVAASDGNQFAVIIIGNRKQLIRLDERGRPLAPPVTLSGYGTPAIAWSGTHYAIILDMKGMLLSPSGSLSAPVAIPYSYDENSATFAFGGKLSLASDGDGFLLVGEQTSCAFSMCLPTGLNAMRLNASLYRVEMDEIPLDREQVEPAGGVVWNGSEYVVAWKGVDSFHTARVPTAAASPAKITSTYENFDVTGIASMPDGTIAIVGTHGSSKLARVAFLRNDGSISRSLDIDSSNLTGPSLLTKVPGGIAYVASSIQDAAPHHGTSHVMMAIARSSVPPPPYPPHVAARLQNGVILVDWSASAGTLNGYRLEYRVDGGSWNELEEWFPADSHHRAIRPAFGSNFEIRMRAFNDGGVSAYSATALTKPTRRRAAR